MVILFNYIKSMHLNQGSRISVKKEVEMQIMQNFIENAWKGANFVSYHTVYKY